MNRRGFLGGLITGVLGLLGVRTATAAPSRAGIQTVRVVSRVSEKWFSATVQEIHSVNGLPMYRDTGAKVWLLDLTKTELQVGDYCYSWSDGKQVGFRVSKTAKPDWRPRFVCV